MAHALAGLLIGDQAVLDLTQGLEDGVPVTHQGGLKLCILSSHMIAKSTELEDRPADGRAELARKA